jgi:hypothetical protein
MLHVTIPAMEAELFDHVNNQFIQVNIKSQDLQLEHSLVSVAKWESKWKKSFFLKTDKSQEEAIDYVRCMTLTQNVDPQIYSYIPKETIKEIRTYIDDPMTATTINDRSLNKNQKEVLTSEIIYYSMASLNIPFECQKWHLNRLLTLISVCNIKNNPGKKMTQQEVFAQNKLLNEQRRRKYGSKG